ncbi:hypothetical protein O6H91_07G122400 [Diphasiastrum complanatum]|uniref:Uncharacterized protein n=1 Tax=Diphasiastrum complanatum TaxID=34168 RepID=A0ACC2D9H6_DIPCM|nr:hypothetical protein O6H91_07G122400 [Diphasiastrum complanatum]
MFSLGALGIGLSVVFGGFVLLLVAELYYLLCWKKKAIANPRVNNVGLDPLFVNGDTVSERSGDATVLPNVNQLPTGNFHAELVAKLFPLGGSGEIEVLHLNHLLGPPRLLFTIIEETKEDLDSEDGKSKGRHSKRASHGSNECILLISSESATPEGTPFVTPPSSPSFSSPRSPILSPSVVCTLPLPTTTSDGSSPRFHPSPRLAPMPAFAFPAAVAQRSPLGIPPPLTPPCTPPLRSALSSPFERTSPLHCFPRAAYRSYYRR